MKIISACLLGINCMYNGANSLDQRVLAYLSEEQFIAVYPEQLGGLPTPRDACEIQGQSGEYVLDGCCRVLSKYGKDLTDFFIKGAQETLDIALKNHVDEAILRHNSPSCGCGSTYDGTFSHSFIRGDGVTTALLRRNGIKAISEENL